MSYFTRARVAWEACVDKVGRLGIRMNQLQVEEFHRRTGQNPPSCRDAIAFRHPDLDISLLREECDETVDAIIHADMPAAVDGLCDLIYICLGRAVDWGVDLQPFFAAVHEANMAKVRGGLKLRSDGKILKPEGWTPPDIAAILEWQKAGE